MYVHKNIAFMFVGLLLSASLNMGIFGSALGVEAIENKMTDLVKKDAQAGQKVLDWRTEQEKLIAELRHNKIEIQWLELQTTKLKHYLENTSKKIQELEETTSHYAVIELQLENAMWTYYEELASLVENDLPFLKEERTQRLEFIKNTLDDPDISLGEKFRRFSEALNVEGQYGSEIKVELGNAVLGTAATDLILIRAGRVGLYAVTLDNKVSGVWHPASKTFRLANEEEHAMILSFYEATNNIQFLQLLTLPVPPIEEIKDEEFTKEEMSNETVSNNKFVSDEIVENEIIANEIISDKIANKEVTNENF